jgi:hypothetical protein
VKGVAAPQGIGLFAQVNSVSCAAPGDCSAGGSYQDSSGHLQAFVVTETNGTWGELKKVATAFNAASSDLDTLSCASVGNCSAGGLYRDGSGNRQAFVADETNGIWATGRKVAGVLNTGGDAQLISVSCSAAGDCSAVGAYTNSSGQLQAFVVSKP